MGRRCAGGAERAHLVNHGIVVAESDVRRAVFGAVLMEKACRMQLVAAAAVGAGALRASSDEEAEEKRGRVYGDRQLGLGWDYLVRSLS
ncbi:class II aldolase/adducin family protein [Blastococcus haudaquaticus]